MSAHMLMMSQSKNRLEHFEDFMPCTYFCIPLTMVIMMTIFHPFFGSSFIHFSKVTVLTLTLLKPGQERLTLLDAGFQSVITT